MKKITLALLFAGSMLASQTSFAVPCTQNCKNEAKSFAKFSLAFVPAKLSTQAIKPVAKPAAAVIKALLNLKK